MGADAAVDRMVLGAQFGEQTALLQSLLLFGGLLLVLMLAAVFVLYVRRRLRQNDPEALGVLSLGELRPLRDNGAITLPEYERLRTRMVDAVRTGDTSESGASAR